ncbi:sperm-associated antigen 5 isoform X2 [Silurus meridionalis]|uniref:Sperm-associated antigen 5 n=1 Tax=Silurus meridionalis TaxID=175797 RepID=A0A8T0BXE2_SILME|nr:sperm-associated antigen 5 isoform X2 [Silurus meridionalis]KAF7710030.1 hypothetical protein HF521_008902 [Silurus meridionalis]
MSGIRAPHTVRCERAPLRDVQNERSALQQTPPTVKVCEKENVSDSSFITDSDLHLCRSETNTSNITFKSFTCSGGVVEISDRSDLPYESDFSHESDLIPNESTHTFNNTTVTHEDAEGQHQDHPYCTHPSHSQQEELQDHLTFKSFTCPGGEVQIKVYNSILHHESVLDNGPNVENPTQRSDSEECEEHTELPSCHFDHLHCNPQTSELRSVKMEGDGDESATDEFISKNFTDVTFKSFTCPGGEVEITEESLLDNVSHIADYSEVQNLQSETFEEHTELPSRLFDHLYCNTQISELRSGKMEDEDDGGSVNHPSITISKNYTDVAFKSFTCPEVEIAEESSVQGESLVKIGSLLTKDLEVQNLLSETCEEHTELPSHHYDHPYSNDKTASTQVDVSATHSSQLDATNPGGVVTTRESSSVLNISTAEECSSGTGVEIQGTERMIHMSMLMQDLNISHQSVSFPTSELSEHDGKREDDEHVYGHVVRNDQPVIVSENKALLSVLVSKSGVLESSESAVRKQGPDNIKAVPESSSDPTEEQKVDSIQQQDSDLQTSKNHEENVLNDKNTPSRCDFEEVFPLDNDDMFHSSAFQVNGVPEKFVPAEVTADISTHAHPEILRSESVDVEAQMKMWSHIILSEPSTAKNSELWLPESPIHPPQLHSTILTAPLTPHPAPDRELQKVMKDFSAVGGGPLQDQLRKMGELLIAASGKISAPEDVAPVQQHSACVWTTPTRQQERSTNTSAIMEERKEIHVADACTSTDSLLWSMSRSNLECLSRSELEQKMISTLIMVEVLSQQLMSAQTLRDRREPGPSSLRDRLVQTEHTELSPTGPHRELYVSALERIRILEIDQETVQSLHQSMQLMSNSMMSIKSETEEALSSMKELKSIVTDDQEIQSQQLGQMKALLAHCMDTLKKMEQKNRMCVKDRDDMKQKMEDALKEKSTVLRVLEQFRIHHTTQVSDLQRNLGSHGEMTDALTHTYKELVELNRNHMDSVTEANTLLRETLKDHTHLSAELHRAQQLLQRTYPVLHTLQHRASSALQQSITHQEERDRAVEDRGQMEQQLYDTHSSLQEAHQQIADLHTQITIMSSEMAVLREQLSEVEDERSQLQRKSTELSATVSSSLASYTFLEQTLASETSKLQRSLHDTQQATERADSLQAALVVCERRVGELEQMLEQRDHLISELSTETENQQLQLHRLTRVQTELSNTKEMSEFLQAENEMTREQLAESEGLLRSHLQGLRERNLECEDLRVEIQQLRVEKECVQQELVSTRDKARLMLLDQGEQLAQATLDTSLLLQRVCALNIITHTTEHHNHKSEDGMVQTDPSAVPQPSSSFLHCVMNALTEEQSCASEPPTLPEEEDPVESMGSRSSAFTRITPSELPNDAKCGTTLLELLSSLGESVSVLHQAIEQLKQHKDSEIHTLQKNIRDLQGEMKAQSNRHGEEEAELKKQVGRLKGQMEKDAQVLQQKTMDEKALRKLCSELEEKMEAAQKHRVENSELRREGAELRRELQQSQVEVQALRAELSSKGQSAASMKDLDDKIRLLREVEKLKASLLEVEESRSRLLERAKRHQMVHAMNRSKMERELHLLDDMIEVVRKALSAVPDVVNSCPELQKLVEYLS